MRKKINTQKFYRIMTFFIFKNENQRCFIFQQKAKLPICKKIKGSKTNIQEKKVSQYTYKKY